MGLWRNGTLVSTLLVGIKPSAAFVGNSKEFPKEPKNDIAFGPNNSMLALHTKDPETLIQRTYAPQCSHQHNLQ